MFTRISPVMRAELGLADPPAEDDKNGWDALYRCVRTRFHGFLDLVDPSPLPKNRRLDPDEFAVREDELRVKRALDDGVLGERRERLMWVANQLIEASIGLLPRSVRRRWNGSVGVDMTLIEAFAHGEVKAKGGAVGLHSSDPDAGWYVRPSEGSKGDRGRSTPKAWRGPPVWGYEATLVVSAADSDEGHFPSLIVGMAPLQRPGTNVGQSAVSALASVVERGHPAGWLGADRAYTNAKAEHFQLPARALGYSPVLDYKEDQLGVQGTYGGAVLIEGAFYCPAIPEGLKTATADHRADRIEKKVWEERIKARLDYQLRPNGRPDPEGHVRQLCPASHAAPTARCDLKPRSINTSTAGGTRIHLTPILKTNPPTICRQQSLTFPPEHGAKLLQVLPYGGPEWQRTYAITRNAVEGMNGFIKDGAAGSAADPERRRIRGLAAQTFFVALLAFAANLRKIQALGLPDAPPKKTGGRRRRRTTASLSDWRPSPPTSASNSPPT